MDGATVSVLAGGHELRVGSNEQVEGPWGALVARLKASLEGEVLDAPVAAIELQADASRGSLGHLGDEPLEVDTSSVAVRAVRLDAQGLVLGRWQGTVMPAEVEDARRSGGVTWTSAGPGWEMELPFRHGLELTRDDWLQVWVTVAIRDGGEHRRGRLFLAVSGGEG
jgi:hypothetical protein